jgi:hypothetical protein
MKVTKRIIWAAITVPKPLPITGWITASPAIFLCHSKPTLLFKLSY